MIDNWKDKIRQRKVSREPLDPNRLGIDITIPDGITKTKDLYEFVEGELGEKGFKLGNLCKQYKVCNKTQDFDELKTRLNKLVNFTN